ncbi:hypothetical protein H0H92_009138 [Tricholoma furcatifolium]|nr:hypothetical protein H0H92_009138 [Tricholoma furcatifolium]
MPDVVRNQGALVLGGFIATWLSGMVTVQTLLYFKLYPLDTPILKALVPLRFRSVKVDVFDRALDFTHSGLVITSVWSYVIQDFENAAAIDDIHVLLAITFIFTAIVTFIVHCFFVHRIFLLSRGSWIMTMPILFLAICSAAATCVEL